MKDHEDIYASSVLQGFLDMPICIDQASIHLNVLHRMAEGHKLVYLQSPLVVHSSPDTTVATTWL